MPEPDSTTNTTLTLSPSERDLLERIIVTAAPGMARCDQDLALGLWERVARDTVAVDVNDPEAGCLGCHITWHGQTRLVQAVRGCPAHWKEDV